MKKSETIYFKEQIINRNFIDDLPYNKDLKEKARALRKSRNLAEVLFWNEVKKSKFHNLDFDRQRVVGNYIVDFYVKSLGLVIEIDGCSHDFKQERDKERQDFIESLSIRFFRVSDYDVRKNMPWVLNELEVFILKHYS